MIGLPVDTSLRPQERMEVVAVTPGVADLVARGLKDRPELVEHQAKVEAAVAAIELAKAGGRPAVGLTGALSGDGIASGSTSLGGASPWPRRSRSSTAGSPRRRSRRPSCGWSN